MKVVENEKQPKGPNQLTRRFLIGSGVLLFAIAASEGKRLLINSARPELLAKRSSR